MADKNVVCLKWGDKYGPEYVNRLYSMVQRTLNTPHRFVCLTDDRSGLHKQIETKEINRSDLSHSWNKLLFFQDPLFDLTGAVLYLDIDIVILDDIAPFFEYEASSSFTGIQDWYRRYTYNTSVFRFQAGNWPHVLEEYIRQVRDGTLVLSKEKIQGEPGRSPIYIDTRPEARRLKHKGRYPSDQEWITDHIRPNGTHRKYCFPKKWCLSYKKNCLRKAPGKGTKIVVFHGRPNPHEVTAPWVLENWR